MILSIIIVFCVGYIAIIAEELTKINKAATAIITGITCWTLMFIIGGAEPYHPALESIVFETSSILFFLIGAMTIVELMDAHDAFAIITSRISTSKGTFLIMICTCLTFFLSAVLDNLTTAIVMVSITRKLVNDPKARMLFAGMIIIASNAGGAWSPIGDVTTTMLWIKDLISPKEVITSVILPSIVSAIVPMLFFFPAMKNVSVAKQAHSSPVSNAHRNIMFYAGIGGLLFVPVFKTITHLPPFMGVMFSLGCIWILAEFLNHTRDTAEKAKYSVASVIRKIDMPGIIFFLGILMAVGALQVSGVLRNIAESLGSAVSDIHVIAMIIGLVSAVVDNVPIVAAAMGMYELPLDHSFWHFVAFTAGTGGSCLVIGSASGVAVMGMEKLDFMWYLRKVSFPALCGYFAGCGVFMLQLFLGS